jgi:DNA-directed RNA polymerase specialized sigma24 family protein
MPSATSSARRWILTRRALVGLLSSLNPDEERAAIAYERLRHKLIIFFSGRGCASAEDCADETLDRLSRRIENGETIRDLGRFAQGVARLVLSESRRSERRHRQALSQAAGVQPRAASSATREETYTSDAALDCLRRCAAQLAAGDRELAVVYYQDSGRDQQHRRQELAARLGISVAALRLRAFRMRRVLQKCTRDCLERATR